MAFPTVPTVANGRMLTNNQADTVATRTFPSLSSLTKNAGDRLIAIIAVYQSSAAAGAVFSGWGGGFTEIADRGGTTANMSIGVAEKISTGSETGTFTVTQAATIVGHASMILMSIPGAHPSTASEVSPIVHGTAAAADPASFDPAGWGAEDTLWIAVGANGETSATGSWTAMNGAPTNYTDYQGTNPPDSSIVGQSGLAVAFRQLNASAEDVGPFTLDTSNARNSALVIAVRPDAAPVPVAGSESFALSEGTTVVAINASRTDAITTSDPTPAEAITASVVDAWTFTDAPGSVVQQTDKAGSESFALKDGSPSYPEVVLADSPRGYWRQGDGSLALGADSSGNGLNGSYTNTPTLGVPGALAGDPDTAVRYSKASQGSLLVADNALLDLGDVFTLEAWVKRNAISASIIETVISKGTNAYVMRISTSNLWGLSRAGVAGIVSSTATFTDTTQYHHLVITKNGADVHLYFDGVDVTGTITNATCTDNAFGLRVGSNNLAGIAQEWVNADVDEVAVYATPLSGATVLAHYNAGVSAGITTSIAATLATSDTPGVLDSSVTLGLTTALEAFGLAEVAGVATTLSVAEAFALAVEISALSQGYTASESFSLTEASSLANTLATTDSWALADVMSLSPQFNRTESFTLAELAAIAEQALLVASDVATVAEQASLAQAVLLAANDSWILGEAIQAQADMSRADSDTFTDAPGVLTQSEAKAASEAHALGELAAYSAVVAAAESHLLGEAADQGGNQFISVSESLLISEAAGIAASLTTLESFGFTDLATKVETLALAASDSASVSEALLEVATALAADTFTLSEQADAGGNQFINAVDSAGFTDTSALVQTVLLAAADAFTVAEAASLDQGSLPVVASDAALLSETLSIAAQSLATENHAASEVAAIAATLAMRVDNAVFEDEAVKFEATFVEIVSALVTAAVTIQGVTQTLATGAAGASSAASDEPTGAAQFEPRVPGSATAEEN